MYNIENFLEFLKFLKLSVLKKNYLKYSFL